jgi:hypothetical protein
LLELVAAHIRSVLEGHQVFEPVDHEELKVVLQMGMKTFSGVSTEAQNRGHFEWKNRGKLSIWVSPKRDPKKLDPGPVF